MALFLLLSPLLARAQSTGYALDFNGSDNYVNLSLSSPPASNYTITAWVKLRTGGTYTGTRMAVLGGTTCGDSIELLIRSATSSAADPQYVELGRCGSFNGFASTNPVPTNAWTHVAVTLSSNKVVSYYINGSAAGAFTDSVPSDSYVFGATVRLGDNNGARVFDGQLYNVQIWDRVLSPTEVTNNLTQQLTGSESGLYAWYPFTEGSGSTTADAATAAGGSAGTLVNNPGWLPVSGLVVTNTADFGANCLRQYLQDAVPYRTITFGTNLAGATLTLTNGALAVNESLAIDGSALAQSVTLSGNNASGIFSVGAGATVSLVGLTLVNGNQYDGGAVYGAAGSSVSLTRCTLSGNFAVEGGALLNDGAMVVTECTLANNFASYGGAMQCRGATTISQSTLSQNTGYYGGGGLWVGSAPVTVNNSIIAANTAPGGTPANLDIEVVTGPLTYSGSNLVQFADGLATGPAPLTNAPLLLPLANYGGPLPTMLPMPNSPVIDAASGASLAVDQRGLARVVGPLPDLGAVEFQDASPVVTTTADSGLGSLRFAATYTTNGQLITFDHSLAGSSILLTSGQILLKPSLTIDASALPGGIQIDGNNNSRIFQVNNANAVVLNSLTLTNGNGVGAMYSGHGGAIACVGLTIELTLNNCRLVGNHASIFGGGLGAAFGIITAKGTTFANNSCPTGGGVNLQGSACTFDGCTFSSNSGSGLFLIGFASPVTASVINSTFTGNVTTNTSGAALDLNTSYPRTTFVGLTNCTLTGNANLNAGGPGAIYLEPSSFTNSVYLYNTLVSGNTAGGVASDLTIGAFSPSNFLAGAYSLLGTGAGLTNGLNHNQVGINNPQLAPLGNYGGNTLTLPPLPGSPAVDAGGPTSLTIDQRGFRRPVGLATDIGAVEGVYVPNATGPGALKNPTLLGNGSFQFGFTNYTDVSFTVWASTNVTLPVSQWSNLGAPLESPAGIYSFIDSQATNVPQRFYRVSSP